MIKRYGINVLINLEHVRIVEIDENDKPITLAHSFHVEPEPFARLQAVPAEENARIADSSLVDILIHEIARLRAKLDELEPS